jgi:hypothetical protein
VDQIEKRLIVEAGVVIEKQLRKEKYAGIEPTTSVYNRIMYEGYSYMEQ